MEGDRWRSGGLEPLHRRPNGPQLEGGIALGAMPPPHPNAKFNSQGIVRTGWNKRTREGGTTEDNS